LQSQEIWRRLSWLQRIHKQEIDMLIVKFAFPQELSRIDIEKECRWHRQVCLGRAREGINRCGWIALAWQWHRAMMDAQLGKRSWLEG
jgi:hypothetical protein